MGDSELKEHYAVIGEFVSKANTFEFQINYCIEQIVYALASVNANFKDDVGYSIDSIHKQSLRERISFIIMILSSTQEQDEAILDLLTFFNSLYKTYNKDIRDYRDFIAHNPYMSGMNAVINSRRYTKSKIESVTIAKIRELNISLTPLLIEITAASTKIQEIYPGEHVVRDLKYNDDEK